ncbi:hypothetical protein C8D96_0610 [Kushneria marisflavi]|nr:hypothetical protein C8D96_0610 [Kushneria marisflavi]
MSFDPDVIIATALDVVGGCANHGCSDYSHCPNMNFPEMD